MGQQHHSIKSKLNCISNNQHEEIYISAQVGGGTVYYKVYISLADKIRHGIVYLRTVQNKNTFQLLL